MAVERGKIALVGVERHELINGDRVERGRDGVPGFAKAHAGKRRVGERGRTGARDHVAGLGPVSYTHLDVYKRQWRG